MKTDSYQETLARFESLVRNREKDRTMVSLIIDSPWLPGYAGASTLDFYFDSGIWLDAYTRAARDLSGVAVVPGTWVEFGMAAEPSGWGAPIEWNRETPPSVLPCPGGLDYLLDAPIPDPERDGLMPVVLRQYERMKARLEGMDMAPRMAAARGPLAIASHLLGVTELLMATRLEPDKCLALLEKTAALCIEWLKSQLDRMEDPIGILVLDDLVGFLSPKDVARFGLPLLKKMFEAFPDLIHIYHNDTPNDKIFEGLAAIGMDVFNFSHEIDLEQARALLGPDIVLMGNLPPLDVLARGTVEEVTKATGKMLEKASRVGPVLISPGGGVSPETPIENLKAMADRVKALSLPTNTMNRDVGRMR